MTQDEMDLAHQLQELERKHIVRLLSTESPYGPATELPEVNPGSPMAAEWNFFRCQVHHLLNQGFKGKYALIKVDKPITVWDTLHDAAQAGRLLYGSEPSLVQEILPYIRPLRVGYNRLCRD